MPSPLPQGWGGGEAVDATLALLHALFLALWLLPVYCVSFALSCVWCALSRTLFGLRREGRARVACNCSSR